MAKFHVGDKVKFVTWCELDPVPRWVQDSMNIKFLTISEVRCDMDDITYFVRELPYAYAEKWLMAIEKVTQKPKFKIGDIVVRDNAIARCLGTYNIPAKITDVLEVYNSRTKEFSYRYLLENNAYEYDEDELKLADKDDILVQSLKICSSERASCEGCYYQDIPDGCDKLEKDAAECIERLKAKIKELEKND